jgi:hypothetical protein
MKMRFTETLLLASLGVCILNGIAQAQNGIDWPRYQDMAVDLMQQYF